MIARILSALFAHPHHVEITVLAIALLIGGIWVETKRPEPWLQWLLWATLMGPMSLFLFDDRGTGLDTSPRTLGIALAVGVLGGGMVALRAFVRHEGQALLEERLAPKAPRRHHLIQPMNLDG